MQVSYQSVQGNTGQKVITQMLGRIEKKKTVLRLDGTQEICYL